MQERVWDKYLSNFDREHLALSNRVEWGFGSQPALLMIDLYRGAFGDRPSSLVEAVEDWPNACGLAAWEALPPIQRLLQAAREAALPVIHVTGLPERDSGIAGWAVKDRNPAARREVSLDDIEAEGVYEIMAEVAPIQGEVFLRKSAPSVFWGTPLGAHLTALGIDTLIVAGETTSGCVRASVVDGCTHRYRMIVVEQCVFDRHQAPHAVNLFDMNQKYADVLALDDVIAWIRRAV